MADLLLAEHLELLFGQHVSVAIACAIYYTVRSCNIVHKAVAARVACWGWGGSLQFDDAQRLAPVGTSTIALR